MFSEGFSEGQTRDINGEFPSDSLPYTDDYEYLSDSDLEDAPFYSEEEPPKDDGSELPNSPQGSESQVPLTPPSEHPPRPLPDVREAQNDDR